MKLCGQDDLSSLVDKILGVERADERRLICLAGPPASGKSSLADNLVSLLAAKDCPSQVVPMDGFHLHNKILMERGLLSRKGAPETFDVLGMLSLVARLRDRAEVFFPTFDRNRDITIAGSGIVEEECDTILLEGNYLLLNSRYWRELHEFWDLSIYLEVPEAVLTERLTDRWLAHGLSLHEAEQRARQNDLINAQIVREGSFAGDVVVFQ